MPFAPHKTSMSFCIHFCVHTEEIQRLHLLIPSNFDNYTKPDPETLLPSPALKVLEKPANFMIEINVFHSAADACAQYTCQQCEHQPLPLLQPGNMLLPFFFSYFFFFSHYPFNTEQGY